MIELYLIAQSILTSLIFLILILLLVRLKRMDERIAFMRRYFLKTELRTLDLNCIKCGKPIKEHSIIEAQRCGIRI